MPDVFVGSWQATTKVAGQSSAREVRDVKEIGPLIVPGPFQFCNLVGNKMVGDDKKKKDMMPAIGSEQAYALEPEVYDYGIAPWEFNIISADAGADVGSSYDWTLNEVDGLEAPMVLHHVDDGVWARINSVNTSTNVVNVTIIVNEGGVANMSTDANKAQLEIISSSFTDAPTVPDGVNREPENRTNYIQFMIAAITEGILHRNQKLYADGEEAGQYFKAEMKRRLMELYVMREGWMTAGQKYSEGSGASRRLYAGGLEWAAGSVYENNTAGGEASYDTFLDMLETATAAGMTDDKLYILCDSAFARVVTKYGTEKKQVHDNSNKYVTNITEVETPIVDVCLVKSQFLNKAARRGQGIAFQPSLLKRRFLRNMDLTYDPNLNVPNVLLNRAAYYVAETMNFSNPNAITLISGFMK
jgi:hypothetical protein